jgi:hypothetical protein
LFDNYSLHMSTIREQNHKWRLRNGVGFTKRKRSLTSSECYRFWRDGIGCRSYRMRRFVDRVIFVYYVLSLSQ